MARTIRFHLDENVDPRIATGLKVHGVDVTTTTDVGLLQGSDDEQLAYVISQGRVLLTQDADFLRIVAGGRDSPGVVFFQPQRHSIGDVIRGALLIWEVYEPDDMKNRVEYL